MLDTVADIMSWVIILVEVITVVTLFDSLLTRKKIVQSKVISYIVEVVTLVVLTNILANISINQWIDVIKFPFMYFFVTMVFHRANFIIQAGLSIIFYTTLIMIDYFTFLIISNYLSTPSELVFENPLLFFMAASISKSLHFFLIIAFKKIASKHDSFEYISKYHWLIYVIQSIITALALLSIINISSHLEQIPYIATIASVGLLFLNIAVFGLLESSARFGNNLRENALLKQQVEIELGNLKLLSQTFEAQRQYMHDYKHNLGIIHQLLAMNMHQEAINYIKPLSEAFYHALYRIKTDHNIIDAILNLKHLEAKRAGIDLDVRAGNLSNVTIPDDLLVTIMSNVLENALEACQCLNENKIVSVKCVKEDELLIFSVINPVNSPARQFSFIIKKPKYKIWINTRLKNILEK